MKKLLLLFILLSTMDCFSQISSLTVDFSPSFIAKSRLSVVKENSKYSMTIIQNGISEKGIMADSLMTDLQLLLVDYFKQKFTLDSIIKNEEIEMEKNGVQIFELDGIGVKGVLVDNKNERSFNFSTPRKGTIDHHLMVVLYKLMYKAFTKPETINYLEQMESYFSLGLGLKKLKDSPLTYKIYGSITSDEEKELSDFFRGLPTDKEIYFDMSNFNGMGTMFYESFKTFCQKNRGVSWIKCSEAAKEDLTKAGVEPTSIR